MLQQTQVFRVLSKYAQFIENFPTIQSLARATLREVLSVWSGLGYNRPAKYLHEAAKIIVSEHEAMVPRSVGILSTLPGIGHNTGAAIMNYAFNIPVPFVETNIRAVYLFFFFKQKQNVNDNNILDIVQKTIDVRSPREWFYALTDYGVHLKTQKHFQNIQSKHYTKQSKFEGSRRQLRGIVLKEYTSYGTCSIEDIQKLTERSRTEIQSVLDDLKKEGMLTLTSHLAVV